MSTGMQNTGRKRVRAGTPALIIVRSPCTHNSRELREAHTLESLGYRAQILGVVSEQVRDRHAIQSGNPGDEAGADFPLLLGQVPVSGIWAHCRLGGCAGRRAAAAGRRRLRSAYTAGCGRWTSTAGRSRSFASVRPALIHCNDYNTMWVGVAARHHGRHRRRL